MRSPDAVMDGLCIGGEEACRVPAKTPAFSRGHARSVSALAKTKPTSGTATPAMLRSGLRCVLTYSSTLRALLGQSLAWREFQCPIWAWFTSGLPAEALADVVRQHPT